MALAQYIYTPNTIQIELSIEDGQRYNPQWTRLALWLNRINYQTHCNWRSCLYLYHGIEGLLRRSNIKTFLKPEVLSLIRGSCFRSYRSLECGIRNAQPRRKDCGTKMSNWWYKILDLGNVRVEQCDLRAGKIKNITDNDRSFTYNFTLNFLALKS